MRIGIDGRTILSPEVGEAAGIGHYTYQLIRHLLKIDKENEYVLFFDYRVRRKDILKFRQKNVKIRYFPFSYYQRYLGKIYSAFLAAAIFSRDKLDLLHVIGAEEVPSRYQGKIITTAYNLAIHKFPEFFSKMEKTYLTRVTPRLLKRSNTVIVTTKSAKKELIELYKLPEEKIKVVYKGLDERFFIPPSPEQIKEAKNWYKISYPYFLFLSTIKPLNNLTRLIEVFVKFKKELQRKNLPHLYQLVLGGKDGWLADEIHEQAKNSAFGENIIFTGYVPSEDLNGLLKGSEMFLFPPLYEEFGTPVLEAMAQGVPVIASDVSTIREIAADAARFVSPYDTDGWVTSMFEVMNNENLRNDLIQRGLARARQFSWEKCARETLEVYKEIKR